MKSAGRSVSSLAGSFAKIGVAAGAAAAAAYAFAKITSDVVELANVQETAEIKLAAVLKATGNAAGFTKDELVSYAGELQNLTTVGDETNISAMSMLATFKNIKGQAFKDATMAALDLSAAMDQDLKSSIVQVGKALNDPIKGLSALSRIGVSFTNEQKEQIKVMQESGDMMGAQAVILEELKGEFGGVAAALRGTFKGAVDSAIGRWADLKEELGFVITKNKFFIESAHAVEDALLSWTESIKENQEKWREWAKNVALAFLDFSIATFEVMDGVGRAIDGVQGVMDLAYAGALKLAQGFIKALEYMNRLTGDTADADFWAQAYEDAGTKIEEAVKSADDNFKDAASGSKWLQDLKKKTEDFRDTISKVDTSRIDASNELIKNEKSTSRYRQEVEKVGDTWIEVWVDTEKEAKDATAQIERDLEAIRTKDWSLLYPPVAPTEQHSTGGVAGVPGFSTGTVLSGYGGGDTVAAMLEPGEGIIRKEAMSVPGMADFVKRMNVTKGEGLQSPSENVNLNLTLPGASKPYTVKSTKGTAREMIKEIEKLNRLRS